jgi:hypothetical protein
MPGQSSCRLRKLVCVPGIHVLAARKNVDGIETRACPSFALFERRKSGKPDLRDKPGHDGP